MLEVDCARVYRVIALSLIGETDPVDARNLGMQFLLQNSRSTNLVNVSGDQYQFLLAALFGIAHQGFLEEGWCNLFRKLYEADSYQEMRVLFDGFVRDGETQSLISAAMEDFYTELVLQNTEMTMSEAFQEFFKCHEKVLYSLACVEAAFEEDLEDFCSTDKYKLNTDLLLEIKGLTKFDILSGDYSDKVKVTIMS